MLTGKSIAKNRFVEVKKNGVTLAQFTGVYPEPVEETAIPLRGTGGKRVKSVLGSETILFVSSHYEVKGSQITKYYGVYPASGGAGATRIATPVLAPGASVRKCTIPQSMTVEYLLADHLGSTSLTTDANGAKVSEMRYREASLWDKPWGEMRYAWTSGLSTTPAYQLTRYTYTGLYSYMDDLTTAGVTEGFGLMFYNARWLRSVPEAQRKGYGPSLGRFAQADTIIPAQSQGIQAWDRYAYVNNAPVNYIDSTGHFTRSAIYSYLYGQCLGKGNEEDEKVAMKAAKCASSTIANWEADTQWWSMITEAQAGDVLFGTVSSPGWHSQGFALTFTGTGDSVLTGIEGDYTSNPVTLVDIQKGHHEGCYAGGYPCFSRDYNWIGITRFRDQGKPTFPYLKPGYEVDDLGAPQFSGLAQTAKWTSIVSSSLGCAIYTTPVVGVACGFLAEAFSDVIIDAMDVEATDHHMQVGPVYFNFQVQPDFNNTWYLENVDYVP